MGQILLTPKGIGKIIKDIPKKEWNPLNLVNSIAKAQLRNIYKWGNTYCYNQEHIKVEGSVRQKRLCYMCWQELLKEAEE